MESVLREQSCSKILGETLYLRPIEGARLECGKGTYLVKQKSHRYPLSLTDSTYENAGQANRSSPTLNGLATRIPLPFPGLSNFSIPSRPSDFILGRRRDADFTTLRNLANK